MIRYKKLLDNRICVLQIIGECNEDRKYVIDKQYAQFRCSKAKVLQIYETTGTTVGTVVSGGTIGIHKKIYKEGMSIFAIKLKYKVGEIVETFYDPSENSRNGIHYFLTEDAAYWYNFHKPYNYSGDLKEFYENGIMWYHHKYTDGCQDGLQIGFHQNGNKWYEYHFSQQRYHGRQQTWDGRGNLSSISNYVYGIPKGIFRSWDTDGNIEYENIL